MKKHVVTFMLLLVSLAGFAHHSATDCSVFKETPEADLAVLLPDNQTSDEIQSAPIIRATQSREDFVNCTVNVKMEVNGVEVEGQVTFYDVSLIECAVIKIAKFFNDLF